MNLSGLLPLLYDTSSYRRLLEELRQGNGEQRTVSLEAAKPFLLAGLYRALNLPMLVVAASSEEAKRLQDELLAWCGDEAPVALFPEPDALPYERLASDPSTVHQRLRVLSALSKGEASLIVASGHALMQKTVPHSHFASAGLTLGKGMKLNPEEALRRWVGMGYQAASAVEVPGAMSRRGGILDIYPPDSDFPVRIELLGEQVESLRLFHPGPQRSLEVVSSADIAPAREVLLPRAGGPQAEGLLRQLDLSNCATEARERFEMELAQLAGGEEFDGLEFYASLFDRESLLDYLPEGSLLVLDNPALIERGVQELDDQAGEMRRGQVERGELPQNFPRPYFTWDEMESVFSAVGRRLALEAWGEERGQFVMSFRSPPIYGGRLQELLEELEIRLRRKHRVVIVSQQASRLSELLEEKDIFASPSEEVEKPPSPGSLALVQGSLSGGWTMGSTLFLTDSEVFGFIKRRRLTRKHPVPHGESLSELSPDDYVVHIEHGIGRFAGVTRMGIDGGEREYLVLEYAQGDKLYVPTEQVDRVTRYIGPGGYLPSLSRLGTQEWARSKEKVKEAANNLAAELLDIYSSREVLTGSSFSPDTVWQQELEASFPYMETPDQLEAVRAVKGDMESPKPMDRLVCGDVGYGKTEVALRAAFKAVMEGKQVAILVPTTVLAQQHFTTFRERLGAFPVRVELLSRFRSEKDQLEVLEGLESGAVDICIGTHRLVQKDVLFKNLGLVVIDEEQRFGVAHKERLKQMRWEVDVLTLSATPIPRTLHMSLVGVRDMSTMETPPEERLPIKTYVSPYEERVVREAILRELERGGQVFFVHNRVRSIAYVAANLSRLVPEARVAIAHGQMPEEKLEPVMLEFSQGKSDVLVCTTIIESGLDMPNVNTLIVNDSDKLGLSQLYQLRGRVGRGSNRAYAYFLFERGKRLTGAAEKRLRTILEATELGAGFRIAMKDLEIRGAGNLLGSEQSGHIGAVGFDLYCRLLAEAVEERKAQQAGIEASQASRPSLPEPTIALPLAAHIPEEYVEDVRTRIALYQRLVKIRTPEEIDEVGQELRDRFGKTPREVRNLLYMVDLKMLASRVGVQSVSTEDKQVVIRVIEGIQLDRERLQSAFGDRLKVGRSQLRLDLRPPEGEWRALLKDVLQRMANG